MQVNIKRVLSFLVVLAMVLSMAPVTGIPAIEAKAETAAAEEHVFDPAAEKNYCEHCKEEVVWTPLHNGESIAKVTEGGKYHYYVAEDMTAATGNFLPDHGAAVAANYSLCLQLNGKKLTVKDYLYCGRQWTINVMGDGEMINSHNSSPMFYVWTCDVNLYGGTFSGPNVAKLDGDSAKVYLHNDATINSNVIALKGNLYLNDSAIANNVQLSGSCKLNIAEGWKGGAKLNVDSALVEEDGKTIKAANVVIGGAYTGNIAWDGYKVENNNGALTKGDTKVAFDASAEVSYCEACDAFATWTALHNGEKVTNASTHWYVAEDMEVKANERLIFGGDFKDIGHVCLNLNGKTVTTKSGGSAAIYGSNGVTINIMGEGTVTNGGTGLLFEVYTCNMYLYGGTYISGGAAAKKAMYAAGSATKVYMYNDVKFEGVVEAKAGAITLNDTASIDGLLVNGGTVTAAAGWAGLVKNADGQYLEFVDGAWKVDTTPEKGVFDPAAYGGYAYCEHCGTIATWTAMKGGNRIGAPSDGKAYHFYLAEDVDVSKASWSQTLSLSGDKTSVCLNLNGHDLANHGRMFATGNTTLAIMGDGNVTFGADNENYPDYKGVLEAQAAGGVYLYGGTYSVVSTALAEGMATINAKKPVYIKNATVNGYIAAQSGSTIKLEEGAVVGEIKLTGTAKVVVAAGWSGSANLTAPAEIFAGAYIAAANGAAEGDFTGSLTCNGVKLVNNNGTLGIEAQEPVWGDFNPEACGGYAYCEVCGEDAGPVLWTARKGANRIDYKSDGGHHHYYLTGDLNMPTSISQLAGVEYGTTICVNLNGYNINYTGRVYIGGSCAVSFFGDGNVTFTGDTTATHATQDYTNTGFYVAAGTSTLNLFGGTYSTAGAAKEDGKPMVLGAGNLNLKNATVNETISGCKVRLEGAAVAADINIATSGKVTVAAGWSGSANLTVPEGAFANGTLAAANGTAEGNFTGKLICGGTELTNQGGTLMADATFNPEAATNYCPVCKKFVAWTALEGDVKIGVVQTEQEAGSDKHEHYYLSDDVNYTGTDNFVFSTRASGSTNYTASSVCINLNGKTLTTAGPLKVGSGSNLNIFANGGAINYTGTGDWYLATGEFRLYGGTYNNVKGYLDSANAKFYLYDGAELNGNLRVPVGQLFLSADSSINKVTLSGSGKINLDASWNGEMVLDATTLMVDGKIPAANVVVNGELKGTIKDPKGNEFTYTDGQLGIDVTFNPEAETSYCKACGIKVKWEALPETVPTIGTEGACLHYYVPADMTAVGAKNAFLFIQDTNGDAANVAPTVCLNLNGKTLTLSQYLYGGFGGVVNVIGDGTLTSTYSTLIAPYTSTINLYGGTYVAKAGGKVLDTVGSGAKVNLFEDAKLQGEVAMSQGALAVYDQAEISMINITGGKTTFKAGWSGSAVLNVAEDLVTDSVVNAANAVAEAGITGKLTDVFGTAYTVNGTSLVVPAVSVDPDVFEPWNHNGYAYCDCAVCDGKQQLVQWIDFNEFTEKNGIYDGIGNNTLSDPSGVINLHFYLSDNITYTTHLLSTYENVCFNFNGYDVTAEKVDTAGHAFSSTQYLVLMNTAEKMATVTGWQTEYAQATALWINGGNASSTTYLCENVTLTTHDGCTADAPIVHLSTNGGKFYLNGGIIDASNRTTAKYPAAVMINGKAQYPGKFYMNSGEIKGGTSTESSGAVQIGGLNTDATYLDGAYFEMNGGTISGGKAASGGNLVLNKNASEAVINGTITGGEATVSGGNIYSNGANLTIGDKGVVSNGKLVFTDMNTFGIGGGNIYFAAGTLTTSGTITNGEVTKFKGAGGNIFLDGNYGDVSFIMNDGEISNGKLPTGEEEIYGGTDFGGQSYGANIRGYKVKEMKLLGGTIEGGIGGNDIKADGRDVYLACSADVVTDLTIGNVTINGAIMLAKHKLTLTGAPKINSVDGENGLTVGETVEMNISGLTEGADIELSNIVANIPLTVACDNAEALKAYFTVIGMDGAVLNVVEGQLMVNGVAIIDGEEATWYATAAEAIAAYTAEDYAAGKYIQLGLDATVALAGAEYLIDLAGQVAGEVAITGTGIAHLFDTANLDLDGYRTVTVAETVTLAERDHNVVVGGEAYRFIIVTDAEGKTSAHCLAMAVNGVNLNTEKAGLSYNAEYMCDDTLAAMISAYGVILSLKDMPGAVMDGSDERTVLTTFAPVSHKVTSTSSTVSGIFKDNRTAARNAQYGKMKIYANAYIQLDLDGDGAADILVADNENAGKKAGNAWSLYDVLLNIDQNWDDNAANQEAAKAFFDKWFDLGTGLYADDFTNLDVKVDVEGGEGEGVTPEDTDVDVEV